MIIKIDREPYDVGDKVYKKAKHEFLPGLNVLVGCNGAGKSTMLLQVQEHCESENIPYIQFNNLTQSGSSSIGEHLFAGRATFAMTMMISSEGERIRMNFERFVEHLQEKVDKILESGGDQLFILLDALDSGLAVNQIADFRDFLQWLAAEEKKRRGVDLYILVAANTYEFCRGSRCWDVVEGKEKVFRTYDSFFKFVVKSHENKEIRYRKQEQQKGQEGN